MLYRLPAQTLTAPQHTAISSKSCDMTMSNDSPPHTPDNHGTMLFPSNTVATVPLPGGVYVPMPAFFLKDTEEVDIPSIQRQASRLIHHGVTGLLLHGSNGEAVHLSRSERTSIIKAVVDTVRHDHDRSTPFPILAGCSAQSVRETVELCIEAAEAGATHAIILPPGYYAKLLSDREIHAFFVDVARASPIPILIYNFPSAANGVDLTSDAIIGLARAEPNIVGVKLTCGNTGKLARVVRGVKRAEGELEGVPRRRVPFFVAGGSADFILQGAAAGAQGTISGLANLCPRACLRILELFAAGRLEEARDLQGKVADADWLAIQYGFVGVKAVLDMFTTCGGEEAGAAVALPRGPCKPLAGDDLRKIREGMKEMAELEPLLEKRPFEN